MTLGCRMEVEAPVVRMQLCVVRACNEQPGLKMMDGIPLTAHAL